MNKNIKSVAASRAYKGSSFYVEVNGRRFDRKVLRSAVRAEGGPGDGRISVRDAQRIAAKLNDGEVLTKAEKNTLRELNNINKFNFTSAGQAELNHLNRSAAAQRREAAARAAAVIR